MTRKEWILANLEGKVQLRALRACEEQGVSNEVTYQSRLTNMFVLSISREQSNYWYAVDSSLSNPDQYLPEGYVDVDHIPDVGKMVEEETTTLSLENWIRNKLQETEEMQDYAVATDSVRAWIDQYNELKNTQVKP